MIALKVVKLSYFHERGCVFEFIDIATVTNPSVNNILDRRFKK